MITSLDFIKDIVRRRKEIVNLYFREYSYPAQKIGTKPGLKDKLYLVKRVDFLRDDKLNKLLLAIKKNRNLGIESKVMTDKGIRHIPMMDYSLGKSHFSVGTIKKTWVSMIIKFGGGGIFETDNSYHFIGNTKLLNTEDYMSFLGWSLLTPIVNKSNKINNIVDVQYVAYSLLKGSACLRITKYPDSAILPHLVATL